MRTSFIGAVCLAFLITLNARGQAPGGGVDPQRVEEIAAMLGDTPFAFGPTIDDRAAWEQLARSAGFAAAVPQAERLMRQRIAELPDDLYLDYSRTGNRSNYQSVLGRRHSRLMPLVIAECIEDRGRFIPAIEQLVAAICEQRSWVLPAHDPKLENFHGTRLTIDLVSSLVANELGQARYLLGDRLSERIRRLIDDNVARRVVEPFRQTLEGDRPGEWWITGENNWNSVCLANVTGAALATLQSREQRALFAAAAEKYSQHFLHGFSADGYCSEGLAYWNYGFSHYVRLSELLWQATGGKLDLFDRPMVRPITLFPLRLEIMNGVYPAFADCPVDAVPARPLVAFLNRRFGLGIERWEWTGPAGLHRELVTTLMYGCPNSATDAPGPTTQPLDLDPLRGWFEQAQVLTCRPRPGTSGRMAVALKGGHNAEQHNHNDVGSWVVVAGTSPLLLDPGSEVYTARTFSKDRYRSNVLNSFGHPVPRVAGKLQRTGRAAQATVLRSDFADAADTLVLDIRSCYEVPELERLERSFVYRRTEDGSLTVTDEVQFASPQTFGTAIITMSRWKQLSPTTLLVYDDEQAVQVEIDSGGAELALVAEVIDEDVRAPSKPTRIGMDLKHPVEQARVSLTVTPASKPQSDE